MEPVNAPTWSERPLLDPSPRRRRCCCGAPKYSCCCVVLVLLFALLAGAAAGAGLAFLVLRQLAGNSSSTAPPPPSACCATGSLLTGLFVGNVSTSKTVLGHTLTVSFQMSHDFRAHNASGGVVDVSLTPYESPFDMLDPFTCANVTFSLRNCSVLLQSACLSAAYAKDDVTTMTFDWQGGDELQAYEGFTIAGFPQSYRWTERRRVR